MAPEVRQALQIQDLEVRIAALQKEIALLPKQIAEIEKQMEAHSRHLEANKSALAGNQRERKRLEGENQTAEQKISKLRDQMMGAKTNEQYRAFQNEIAHFEKEIRKGEDGILELMEANEPLEANVKKAQAELAAEKKQVDARKVEALDRTAVDQKEVAELDARRKALVQETDAPTLDLYARLKKRWGLTIVSEVAGGRCSGCKFQIRAQHFIDIKTSSKLMQCESCGRILFYNPPVDAEVLAGRSA